MGSEWHRSMQRMGAGQREEWRVKIAAYLAAYRKEYGYEPTRTEIAAHFRHSVAWYVRLLRFEAKDKELLDAKPL